MSLLFMGGYPYWGEWSQGSERRIVENKEREVNNGSYFIPC